MMKTVWFRVLVALLSAGWVVPMWLGTTTLVQFLDGELWPLLLDQATGNSFGFTGFADDCFALGFAWLGLVIFAWAWAGAGALQRARA